MTETDEFLQQTVATLPSDKLDKLAKRVARKIRIFTLLVVVALLAGIWVDWRWLPTSVVPMIFTVYYTYLATIIRKDVLRRITERGSMQDG